MSVDILGAIGNVATGIVCVILLLGIYRALKMRGAFVSRVYRSRATWSAFFMLVILIDMLTNYINFPSSGILSIVGALPFLALIFAVFAYADRSVLVAMDTDFFHRNTLGWLRVRWPATIVLALFVLVVIAVGVIPNPTAQELVWENDVSNLFFAMVAALIAYCTAALIVGARRSSDRTLRRSILLLGLALSTLAFSLVVNSFLTPGALPFVIVNNGTAVVGIYLIYRSVTSLSPLGRVEKDVGAPKPEDTAAMAPSHS